MTLADRIAVLSGGRTMQYDTPEAIYNRPAALFVAGFTGAPPMNLADCSLDGGSADLGGAPIVLPAALVARASGAAALKFGVRPENIALAPAGAGAQRVPAQVTLLEPLGAETLVTLRIGRAGMVARAPASFKAAPGTPIDVFLSPQHLHLFDARTGAAL